MKNTSAARIAAICAAQKAWHFRSGATLGERFRRTMLRRLDQALGQWEGRLWFDALWEDLPFQIARRGHPHRVEHRPRRGAAATTCATSGAGCAPSGARRPLKLQPSTSRILAEPLGQALIVAPWNYPVQLLLNPLVGVISAGCTALLKPSPYTPHVSATPAR